MACCKGNRCSARQVPCSALAISSASCWPWGLRSVASVTGSRSPAMMALSRALPVARVMSLTTWASLRFIWLQGLLHVLNMVRGRGDQLLAVAQGAAQHADLVVRAEGTGAQPVGRHAL